MTSHALPLSNSLNLIFHFLDLQSTKVCRLVNKEWKEQVEKHYQLRELKLYKSLHTYSTLDLSGLKPEELTQIDKILLDVSKSILFLRKSTLCYYGQNVIRVIQSMNKPPKALEQVTKAFVALTGNEQTLEWAEQNLVEGNWARLVWNGVNSRFKEWPKWLTEAECLSSITLERVGLAQKYVDESPIDADRVDTCVEGGKYWFLWVTIILECAKKRLALSEYARSVLDIMNQNTPLLVKEELVKVNKLKEWCEVRKVRDKSNQEVKEYEEKSLPIIVNESKEAAPIRTALVSPEMPENSSSAEILPLLMNKKTSCCELF